jgi:hypothetical protein
MWPKTTGMAKKYYFGVKYVRVMCCHNSDEKTGISLFLPVACNLNRMLASPSAVTYTLCFVQVNFDAGRCIIAYRRRLAVAEVLVILIAPRL